MILFGAGGHSKVIVDILKSKGIKIKGVYDDNPEIKEFYNLPVLGSYSYSSLISKESFIIAIGDNRTRKKIALKIKECFDSAIHTSTIISKSSFIGKGTCIMANVIINANSKIGEHCIINTAAVIEHDCDIDSFVHICPNATITGNVIIGEGTFIGAGAVVIPNISIGKWAVIGAGSIVLKDVPDYAIVAGNPGKVIKYNDKNE